MAVFFTRPPTGNKQKPRIRLVNGRSLAILTLTTLWALWLISPSQNMLIQLISRSASPEVSLAFLREINVREPENRAVVKQLIDNYYRLGELDKALAIAETILTREDLSQDWPAFETYLQLLLDKYHQADVETHTEFDTRLRRVINSLDYIPEAELARKVADTAIELSMIRKGFDILLPHLQSGETSYHELISLALQNADYDSSLQLQLDAFREFETLAEARRLFELLQVSNKPQLSQKFINKYSGNLSLQPDFLRLTINHSNRIGDTDLALAQSKKLLTIEPTNALLASTAELAVAAGDLPLATSLLTQLIARGNNPEHIGRLHDLYRWQGKTREALVASTRLLAFAPTESQLRAGIEEARALGDIEQESEFYSRLAFNNQITLKEYSGWLNAVEKAQGTDTALAGVKQLAALRPDDPALILHQARLYDYQGNFIRVTEQWEKLSRLRAPTTVEARRFSNAYIMTREPKMALAVLTAPANWLDADEDYLEAVSSLAWETSNRKIAQLAQQQLLAQSSQYLDVYRYLRTHSPATEASIDALVRLYHSTGDTRFLLAALQAASETEDKAQFEHLMALAASTPSLANNTDILLFRARLAVSNRDNGKAHSFYQQVLKQDPLNIAAINGLLWLAIKSDKQGSIHPVYNRYKALLNGEKELWLGFATAAQLLRQNEEAQLWYKKLLLDSQDTDLAVLLNYATVLELQEQYDTAYKLRRYIVTRLSDKLLQLEDGDISYRSLVAQFLGDNVARALVEEAALSQPSDLRTAELFRHYLASEQTDNLLFWHQRTALKQYTLPDWQQLSVAIKRKDRNELERLLDDALSLPHADRNMALQLTGQYQAAWQHGQNNLGQLVDRQAEKQLRQVHVNQHPDRTHSLRSQVNHNSQWEITRYSLDYYAPYHNGFWRAGSDYQTAATPEQLIGNNIDNETRVRGQYFYRRPEAIWQIGLDLANGVGDQRLGATASYQTQLDSYWNASLKLGINNPIQASQLLTLAGKDNIAGLTLDYQPTAREAASLHFNLHELSTRFGDDIGSGWDLNIHLSEQLFFADPAWQLYTSLSMQKVNLSSEPLNGINAWHQGATPLTSADFIDDDYRRIAIGQRIWHGAPGIPGATVPSPRYWLDSSIGYNVTNNRPDMTLGTGLGWRIVDNDELYFSADWQSQDRNGDESLSLSLGYYYSF